jgi:hypothetical protein
VAGTSNGRNANWYTSLVVGWIAAPDTLTYVIATVLSAVTRTFAMPRPACAAALLTTAIVPGTAPVTVKVCSDELEAATEFGDSVAVVVRPVEGLTSRICQLSVDVGTIAAVLTFANVNPRVFAAETR